jgi:hypothetical protein
MPRPFGPNPTAAAERTRRWRAKRKESLMIDQTDEQQRKTDWVRRMAEVQAGGPENSDTGVVSQQPAAQALKPIGAAEAVAPLPASAASDPLVVHVPLTSTAFTALRELKFLKTEPSTESEIIKAAVDLMTTAWEHDLRSSNGNGADPPAAA